MQEAKGTKLAKVLYYYGLIPDVDSDEQKIVCPFHEDVNPSMKVDLQDGSYFCFGCNCSGDSIRFVYEVEKKNGLNELQSAIKHEKILRSNKVEAIHIGLRKKRAKNLTQFLTEAEDDYFNLPQDDWTKRPEDPDKREAIQYMRNRGFTLKALTEIGCKYNYGCKSYPLIFPMMDNGSFKGWVCRTIYKSVEEKRKYLYNKGFSRRNTLCGTYDGSMLYIVEGYMDMLKMKSFGVKNVVAILGWKATNEQIQKLKDKGYKHIISALDNDKCGNQGSIYLENYFGVTRFQFPKGVKDPGDMDKEMFKEANRETMKLYKIKELKGDKKNGRIIKQNQKRS